MTGLQSAAYGANALLALSTWSFPRARLYVLALFGTDILRLILSTYTKPSLAFYALDGALMMLCPIVLARCLKTNPWPFIGLGGITVGLAVKALLAGRFEQMVGIYIAALAAAHVFTTILPVCSREWRRNFDVESFILIGLSATGLAGAFVVIAWEQWDVVNTGNITAHVVLGFVAVASQANNKRV